MVQNMAVEHGSTFEICEFDPDHHVAAGWEGNGILGAVCLVGNTVDGDHLELVHVQVERVEFGRAIDHSSVAPSLGETLLTLGLY